MIHVAEASFPVIVTGGRDYMYRKKVFMVLDELNGVRRIDILGHGACRRKNAPPNEYSGADRWAHEWAMSRWTPVIAYPADWEKYGKKAGIIRNWNLSDLVRPKCCVAFPGGTGTEHMVLTCKKITGCYVLEIDRATEG